MFACQDLQRKVNPLGSTKSWNDSYERGDYKVITYKYTDDDPYAPILDTVESPGRDILELLIAREELVDRVILWLRNMSSLEGRKVKLDDWVSRSTAAYMLDMTGQNVVLSINNGTLVGRKDTSDPKFKYGQWQISVWSILRKLLHIDK